MKVNIYIATNESWVPLSEEGDSDDDWEQEEDYDAGDIFVVTEQGDVYTYYRIEDGKVAKVFCSYEDPDCNNMVELQMTNMAGNIKVAETLCAKLLKAKEFHDTLPKRITGKACKDNVKEFSKLLTTKVR